jgi:hypothetical protein
VTLLGPEARFDGLLHGRPFNERLSVSTTGIGDPFGGPPQARERVPRPTARDERRRISERLAEAAAAVEDGRVRGMPSESPWQRSNAVWHRAGIDWTRVEPEARRNRPATVPPPRTPASATGENATEPEPWVPARQRRLPAVPARPLIIAVVAVLVIGGGAYLVFGRGGGGETPAKSTEPAAVAAGRLFALDSGAAGRAHSLDGIAASGGTVVAIGSEQGGVYPRGQFLTSADGGRTWSLARVRAADGGDPPQGEFPQFVAGGANAWAALGSTPAGVVPWTSHDGRTWTRQPVTGAFGPADKINELVRTASGFVAAGTATVRGSTQAILWTSADGGTWTRLGVAGASGAVAVSEVAARGATVVARGRVRTTKTVTVTRKKKKRKVQRTVESEAF